MTNGINDAPKPSEAIHIPPAALEAGASHIYGPDTYRRANIREKAAMEADARAAFVAMVEAWPDMAHRVMPYAAIVLPLMEKTDGE